MRDTGSLYFYNYSVFSK